MTQQHRKNIEYETQNIEKKTNSPSPHEIMFCLIGTPCAGQKQSLVLQSFCLSASYAARPPRDHLATDSIRVKVSLLSATVSPVDRLACNPVLTVAVVLDYVDTQTSELSLSI